MPPQSPPPQTPPAPAAPLGSPVTPQPRLAPGLKPVISQPPPTKVKPQPSGNPQNDLKQKQADKRLSKKFLIRPFIPLIFLALTGILILSVRKFLLTHGRNPTPPVAAVAKPPASPSPGDKTDPINQPPPAGTTNSPEAALAQSMDQAVRPSVAAEAQSILEKFLRADTLEERMPILESNETKEYLADTIIAKPLPSYRNIYIDSQKSFHIENITDIFFSIEFVQPDGSPDQQIMVVRRRGGMSARVLADPFLDLFGGRLAAFAEKPTPKGGTFHAIVYPLPSCNDPMIPDRQRKLTLRLMPHGQSSKVILAYASRISKIGDMLSAGTYDLSYGKAEPCVVLLGWNTTEREDVPYLEALDVKVVNWNP